MGATGTQTVKTTKWTKEWNPASQRYKLIPPGAIVQVRKRTRSRSHAGTRSKTRTRTGTVTVTGRSKSRNKSKSKGGTGGKCNVLRTVKSWKKCCNQKRVLLRSVVRLSARLAQYRAKEVEEAAKKERNKEKRVKAAQRRKEIQVLADAAEQTMRAIQHGEHEGTYDRFMNKVVAKHYGYNDKDFEKVTTEILKGTVRATKPPKAAVTALKRVENVANLSTTTGVAGKVIYNVQSLVKKKKPAN